jgi:AIPR protein
MSTAPPYRALADLPAFLRSPEAFSQHLQDQLVDHDNTGKGDSFVGFALKVLPFFDMWRDFEEPTLSPRKSHDGGVDLRAKHRVSDAIVAGQSKLRVREVADLDGIISKFSSFATVYAKQRSSGQGTLFAQGSEPQITFVIITSSNIDEIKKRYEKSSLPSVAYYRRLMSEERLHIIDGPQLLTTLQALYRQSYLIAPEIELEFAADPIAIGNVYISVVAGKVLRALYEEYGTSLFFENIRDFLGISSNGDAADSNVNDAIVETLKRKPDMMLGRNNGITFRADRVVQKDTRHLVLTRGSIVNGCQTTMCVVNVGETADTAMVAAKIVVDDDSWEVAKSANHQNRVTRIDLEIARFLRPQLVRKVATSLGYGMAPTKEPSISNVLADIHLTKVSYDAVKLLYLGLFSRHPNNMFEGHYSEVRLDILNAISSDEQHERVLTILFRLWMQLGKARDAWRERLAKSDERILDLFKRFFDPDKLKYQCLLAILTACGCVNRDLVKKSSKPDEAAAHLMNFLLKLEVVLEKHQAYFDKVFRHAFGVITERVLSQSKGDVSKEMFNDVVSAAGSNFGNAVLMLRTRMASDDSLETEAPKFAPDSA